MNGFARRPLAFFICCLFAGMQVSHGASNIPHQSQLKIDDDYPLTDTLPPLPIEWKSKDDIPLNLRLERKFNILGKNKTSLSSDVGIKYPVKLKKDDAYPMFLTAANIEGRTDDVTVATGEVELRKADALIFADKLTYWPLEDEIEATGNVRLFQDGAELESPHVRLKMTEQIGFAEEPKYHISKEVESKVYRPIQSVVTVASSNASTAGAPMMLNVPDSYGLPTSSENMRRLSEASGQAERAELEGENQIRLSKATFSTCKPGNQDWYLKASEIHLDYDKEVGKARHASLWFKDVPILYLPAGSFSLNRKRHSGFLSPYYSLSTKTGFDITTPYYWVIAPNIEATLYPRYMTKRGAQIGIETQYLDYNYNGKSRAEYLPKDQSEKRERYGYTINHEHILGRGLSASINWQGVSDDYYWEDMTSRLLQTSQVQLPRQLVLSYSPSPWLQTSIQTLRYQTLQPDPANPTSRPYMLEPQISITAFKPNILKTDLTLIGQYTRFTHAEKHRDQGNRFVLYPQISLPIVHPAFQITPKFGLHMTQYSLDRQNSYETSNFTRTLPVFTLDSTLVMEREGNWLGKNYIQTLEPRLYYVNIPYKDQSNIPLFDSGISDFNFAQIFSENRYSGYDRVNDANQLTAALTTRFLDGKTGTERFKATIGQRYYFKPQRVSIPGETERSADFSHLIAAANGVVLPKTYAEAAWEYNNQNGTNERLSMGMRYQPEIGKVLSASYRYTRDPLSSKGLIDQIDIAGQWPISAKWYAVGRYNWSIRDSKLLEAIGGVEYNAGCWAMRLVTQRLEAISGSPNTTVFFQLELNDFASIGSNPLGLLRRSIPGYGKTNELPITAHPLNTP